MSNNIYTRDEIIAKCEEVEDIKFFYKNKIVNYRGPKSVKKEKYTEIVAEWIIYNIERFQQIIPIHREASYHSKRRNGKSNSPDAHSEKQIAIKMFNQTGGIPEVGIIIDYQTPLKNKQIDKVGEIDLLAYDDEQNLLRILELKIPNSKETMLRCVLEAYTYLKLVDRKKLISDLNFARKEDRERFPVIPENTLIVACPFIFRYNSEGEDGTQYKELQENRPMLKKLMKFLDIKVFVIEETNNLYYSKEYEY